MYENLLQYIVYMQNVTIVCTVSKINLKESDKS